MNPRDFLNALRMTWCEVRPMLVVLFVLPFLGLFYFYFNLLQGRLLLMMFYILAFSGTALFFPPNRTAWNKRSGGLSLEFSLTRAVSRPALFAAKTLSFLLFLAFLYAATALTSHLMRLPIPRLPSHFFLACAGLSSYVALSLACWRYPRARAFLGSPVLFGVLVGTSGASTQFLFDLSFTAHPLLLPSSAALLVAAQLIAYRSFTRQEILA